MSNRDSIVFGIRMLLLFRAVRRVNSLHSAPVRLINAASIARR